MFCSNCGNKINGNFCENCGTKSNAVSNENLVIKRGNSFVGIAINIDVTVDGVLYKLPNDSHISFNLTEGTHVVTYKVWCRSLKTLNIVVHPGRNYCISFRPDYLLGGFKLADETVVDYA